MSEEQNYSSPEDPLMSVDPEDTGSDQTSEERGYLVSSDFSINPALFQKINHREQSDKHLKDIPVMSDGTIQYPPGMNLQKS